MSLLGHFVIDSQANRRGLQNALVWFNFDTTGNAWSAGGQGSILPDPHHLLLRLQNRGPFGALLLGELSLPLFLFLIRRHLVGILGGGGNDDAASGPCAPVSSCLSLCPRALSDAFGWNDEYESAWTSLLQGGHHRCQPIHHRRRRWRREEIFVGGINSQRTGPDSDVNSFRHHRRRCFLLLFFLGCLFLFLFPLGRFVLSLSFFASSSSLDPPPGGANAN